MADRQDGLPDFIVIGAAKAGTTSLAKYLSQRPEVFLTTPKEIEFFARDDHYAKGLDWYRQFYATAEPGQIRGEASTLYSLAPHFPLTAGRIAAHLPGIRLIYILREPVSRAYSYYVQLQKNYRRRSGDRRIHRSFEDFIAPGPRRIPRQKAFADFDAHLPDVPGLVLDGSDYLLQIRSYLAHIPREQMLFLTFEEMRADPQAVFARIHDFLGLAAPGTGAELPRSNISDADFARLKREQTALDVTGRLPLLGRIGRLLPDPLRQRARSALVSVATSLRGADDGLPPPMLPETRRRLEAHFHRDRQDLAALTGLDLDRWWGAATAAPPPSETVQ